MGRLAGSLLLDGVERNRRIAQLVERLSYSEKVAGSTPAPPTTPVLEESPSGRVNGAPLNHA